MKRLELVEYLEVGKIVNTHGVKGEVKVIPLTGDPDRFNNLEWVFIDKNGTLVKYTIESTRHTKNLSLIKFRGVSDLNAAEALKGLYMKVDRKHAVKLPEDSFFVCDLIGCTVSEVDGTLLGSVKDVLSTGSNDVYVIETEQGNELLIPALKSVVREVSVPDRKITVALPEGLLEDEV